MSNVSPSTEQAGAGAPAEAPERKPYRVVIAQSFLHVIDVEAADADSAGDIAWDRYFDGHHRCDGRCGLGDPEVIDTWEAQP